MHVFLEDMMPILPTKNGKNESSRQSKNALIDVFSET